MEKVSKSASHLRRVGTRYHFRYAFSKKYCNILSGEVRVSLRTGDLITARSLAAMLAGEVQNYIESEAAYMSDITEKEIKAALSAYLRVKLDERELERAQGKKIYPSYVKPIQLGCNLDGRPISVYPVQSGGYVAIPELEALKVEELALRDNLTGLGKSPDDEIDMFLKASGIEIEKGSVQYEFARRELLKVQQAINKIEQERAQGEYSSQTEIAILSKYDAPKETPVSVQAIPEEDLAPISEYTAKFITEKESDRECKPSTLNEYKRHLKLFVELTGDCPLSDLDYERTRGFFDNLKKYPIRRNTKKEYRSKSTAEILAMDLPAEKCLSAKTINNHMTSVGAFQSWASQREFMRKNFAVSMNIRIDRRPDEAKDSFTDNEIGIIFDDLAGIYKKPTTAMKRKQTHRWWIPLIGLYSGARLEEISQLHIEDVRLEQGVWILDITDVDDRELKNTGSRRQVPIHNALIKAGFLDYCQKIKGRGERRLFPDLKPVSVNGMQKYGQYITKWFGPYLEKLGVKSSSHKVSFHSLRHTFVSKAKHLEIPEKQCAQVVGHVAGQITYNVYGKRYELKKIQAVVNQITYGIEERL